MGPEVSVIIPVGRNEKESSYSRTIQSLINSSKEDIEILFLADGWKPKESLSCLKLPQVRVLPSSTSLGQRVQGNKGAALARGKYILRIDAHCKMSEGWDVKLKESCSDRTVLVCIIEPLNEETWKPKSGSYSFVYMTPSGKDKWWGSYHSKDNDQEVQPTMSLTGCGWFCKRDYYSKHIIADGTLGKWGGIGPEVALKVEASGGDLLLHKGVRCGHLFNTSSGGYPVTIATQTRKALLRKYHKHLYKLAQKFSPVPTWEDVREDYLENWERYFMYETVVTRKDKMETKDASGKVIKTVLKYYKPVPYVGEENPDLPEVGARVTKDAEVERIKVAELKGDVWEYNDYTNDADIRVWLFENE